MLILAESLKEIRFSQLMEVYSDSIAQAASRWKELPPGLALQLAEQDQYQYLREVFFPTRGAVCAIWEGMLRPCGWSHTGMAFLWKRWKPHLLSGKTAMHPV